MPGKAGGEPAVHATRQLREYCLGGCPLGEAGGGQHPVSQCFRLFVGSAHLLPSRGQVGVGLLSGSERLLTSGANVWFDGLFAVDLPCCGPQLAAQPVPDHGRAHALGYGEGQAGRLARGTGGRDQGEGSATYPAG